MKKMILVPFDKYQRLIGKDITHRSIEEQEVKNPEEEEKERKEKSKVIQSFDKITKTNSLPVSSLPPPGELYIPKQGGTGKHTLKPRSWKNLWVPF